MQLTQKQFDYIAAQVNAAGGTRYTFVTALSTNNDRNLGVVTIFGNGSFHTANVSVGDDGMWLVDDGQFNDVVAKAVSALGGL